MVLIYKTNFEKKSPLFLFLLFIVSLFLCFLVFSESSNSFSTFLLCKRIFPFPLSETPGTLCLLQLISENALTFLSTSSLHVLFCMSWLAAYSSFQIIWFLFCRPILHKSCYPDWVYSVLIFFQFHSFLTACLIFALAQSTNLPQTFLVWFISQYSCSIH